MAMRDLMDKIGEYPVSKDAPKGGGLTYDEIPCRSNDPELWFSDHRSATDQAKALCRECPLRNPCFSGAVERREPFGVWGGALFVDGLPKKSANRKGPEGRARANTPSPLIGTPYYGRSTAA